MTYSFGISRSGMPASSRSFCRVVSCASSAMHARPRDIAFAKSLFALSDVATLANLSASASAAFIPSSSIIDAASTMSEAMSSPSSCEGTTVCTEYQKSE